MKLSIIFLVLAISTSAFGQIQHSTCDLYYPTASDDFDNFPLKQPWKAFEEVFIEKGYHPIEVSNKEQVEDFYSQDKPLFAELEGNTTQVLTVGKKSTCKIGLSISQVMKVDNGKVSQMKKLFSRAGEQKRLTLTTSKVNCDRAVKKIIKKLPKCTVN